MAAACLFVLRGQRTDLAQLAVVTGEDKETLGELTVGRATLVVTPDLERGDMLAGSGERAIRHSSRHDVERAEAGAVDHGGPVVQRHGALDLAERAGNRRILPVHLAKIQHWRGARASGATWRRRLARRGGRPAAAGKAHAGSERQPRKHPPGEL